MIHSHRKHTSTQEIAWTDAIPILVHDVKGAFTANRLRVHPNTKHILLLLSVYCLTVNERSTAMRGTPPNASEHHRMFGDYVFPLCALHIRCQRN